MKYIFGLNKFARYLSSGYSLLEMTLALSLLMGIITGMYAYFDRSSNPKKIEVTQDKIRVIQTALKNFYIKNKYLPCPADPLAFDTAAGFGAGIAKYDSVNKVCKPYSADLTVRMGMVPVTDLGLTNDYAYDAWGKKFTYQLASGLGASGTNDFGSNKFKGDIKVSDLSGTELTKTAQKEPYNYGAAYIIISHGPGGNGAFARNNNAAASNPPNNINASLINAQNAQFTNKNQFIYGGSLRTFEDIVAFASKTEFLPIIKASSPINVPANVCAYAKYLQDRISTTTPAGGSTLRYWNVGAITSNATVATNVYNIFAPAISTMCDNPPIIDACSFTPDRIKPITVDTSCGSGCTTHNYTTGMALWLDGSDPTNSGDPSSVSDGSTVSNWTYKSKSIMVGSSSIASNPTGAIYRYTTPFPNYYDSSTGTVKARHALYFSGNNRYLSSELLGVFFNNAASTGTYTLFVVDFPDFAAGYNVFGGTLQPQYPFSQTTPSVLNQTINVGRGILGGNNANPPFVLAHGTNSLSVAAPPVTTISTATIFAATFNNTITGDTNYPFGTRVLDIRTSDGQHYQSSTNDGTAISNMLTSSNFINIGSNPNICAAGSNCYTGYIGEIILFYTALTPEQRDQVEGYLMRRWFTGECK